jgi:uncharacterized membrane protein
MKSIGKVFLTGVFTVLPVVATVYLVIWVLSAVESFLGRQLKLLIPDEHYHAGMGMLAAVVAIFVVGLLMRAWFFRQLMKFGEGALLSIPLIKTVYKSLKDFFGMFAGSQNGEALQVVSVQFPGTQMKLLGFITRSDFSDLPQGVANAGDVAVYLPMSYQVGGYTVVVPRAQITPLRMARDEAMRFVLTAGLKAEGKTLLAATGKGTGSGG